MTTTSFASKEISCAFKDVPENTFFYVNRNLNGCSADSIRFYKTDNTTIDSPEFTIENFNPNHPCRYYVN